MLLVPGRGIKYKAGIILISVITMLIFGAKNIRIGSVNIRYAIPFPKFNFTSAGFINYIPARRAKSFAGIPSCSNSPAVPGISAANWPIRNNLSARLSWEAVETRSAS